MEKTKRGKKMPRKPEFRGSLDISFERERFADEVKASRYDRYSKESLIEKIKRGLNYSNLSEADLSNADLSGADLTKADLKEANLENTTVTQARFGSNKGINKALEAALLEKDAIF
jgi:hypothetical protein